MEEPRIEIITTAAADPEDAFSAYKEGFSKPGCASINHPNIRTRSEAELPENLEQLEACNCVMMSGGDQLRLSTIFGGTSALRIICRRYEEEQFVVADTSAGASAGLHRRLLHSRGRLASASGKTWASWLPRAARPR